LVEKYIQQTLLVNTVPFGITNIRSSGNKIILFGPLDICFRARWALIIKKAIRPAVHARTTPNNEKSTVLRVSQPK